jgi:hypothetical protein
MEHVSDLMAAGRAECLPSQVPAKHGRAAFYCYTLLGQATPVYGAQNPAQMTQEFTEPVVLVLCLVLCSKLKWHENAQHYPLPFLVTGTATPAE